MQQTSSEHQPQQQPQQYREQQSHNHQASRRLQQQQQDQELLLRRQIQQKDFFIGPKHINNTTCFNPKPSISPCTNETKILYSRLVKTSANHKPAHRKGSAGTTCAIAPPAHTESQVPKNLSTTRNTSTSSSGNCKSGMNGTTAMEHEKVVALLNDHQDQNNNNINTNASSGSNNNVSVIGHYELSRTLGKGNFSTVKLAQHRLTHHSVAIKVVKTSVLSEDNLLKINREIDVLKRLGKHNHIVRLYQVIKTKRYFMLVTEYCANGELYDYLVVRGKLSESQSCNFFQQILSAVEYLHDQNVVHRDLKAENLLLTDDYKTIKIADFGFANYFKQDNLLSTWCGSPPYAAPELFKGVHYVGPPVDIWSMGVILYVLVCGSLPFDGHNLVYLKSRVLSGKFRIPFFMSTECEGLVRGMLRLEPERRFSIRQIKGHSWIAKYGNPTPKTISNNNGSIKKHMPSIPLIDATKTQNYSNVSMATSIIGSTKDLEKNTNRGLSLEMEDEKVKETMPTSNEDASMLCLSSTNGKSVSKFEQNRPNKAVQKSVDTEIATAVSNISLDSNQSSMSVSQSLESNTYGSSKVHAGVAKIDNNEFKCLSKENSMDDQIIEYMVDDLKVADNQNSIRNAIANDRYDELHAIYRLLKDQPNAQLEASATSKKFKIPSLPLISLNKQNCANKPSITTGFFNANCTNSPQQFGQAKNEQQEIENQLEQQPIVRDNAYPNGAMNNEEHSVNQLGAINLITRNNKKSDAPAVCFRDMRQRKSEDQSWKMPPQLFLTPPSENRNQRGFEPGGDDSYKPDTLTGKKFARRSFDSTMQQLIDSSTLPGSSSNQLALTNGAKHGFWDSSILDTLGLTVGDNNPNTSSLTNSNSGMKPQNCDGKAENPVQMLQDFAGITTNLPQIGNQELPQNYNHHNLYNQTLLLNQMNQFAISTAITQSSMLTQTQMPIEFTPNNLMNQNYTVMNNMTLQNNINSNCAPILNLLDPNGLMSVLERRASDGNTNGHHR